MLVLNSTSYSAGTITANFSVNMADIDVDAGEDSYNIIVKRHSDGVTVHTALSGTIVNNGVGTFTGNTSTSYAVSGIYDITVVPTEGGDTVNTTSNNLPLTIGAITMATGTGAGRLYTATQNWRTAGQRKGKTEGNGNSENAAIVELGAKVAMLHGSLVLLGRPRISIAMQDTDYSGDAGALGVGGYAAVVAARDSSGEVENVEIQLEKTFNAGTIDERVETPVIKINSCSDVIKLAGTSTNDIDPANSKVVALVAAYMNSNADTGWLFREGKFVR